MRLFTAFAAPVLLCSGLWAIAQTKPTSHLAPPSHSYKSAKFGFTIAVPPGYKVSEAQRFNKETQRTTCFSAVDSIPGTTRFAGDGRISYNLITIEAEPFPASLPRPSLQRLMNNEMESPVDDEIGGKNVTKKTKQIVEINGTKMVQFYCETERLDRYRLSEEKFTMLVYMNGPYLFRVTSKTFSELSNNKPYIPPGAQKHPITAAKGLATIKSLNVIKI